MALIWFASRKLRWTEDQFWDAFPPYLEAIMDGCGRFEGSGKKADQKAAHEHFLSGSSKKKKVPQP